MYNKINNTVKFKIGAKNYILNSCAIVDDSLNNINNVQKLRKIK